MSSDAGMFNQTATAFRKRRWGKGVVTNRAPLDETAAADENMGIAHDLSQVCDPVSLPSQALAHASSTDALFDCFAVLDFEATCDKLRQPEPQEVVEFPIVLIHAASGEALGEFRTYVQPVHHRRLTAFCSQLTGITQDLVDAAPTWSEAFLLAEVWLDAQLEELNMHRCIFVTCGDWDLASMMGRQCALSGMHVPARFRQWVNIKNLFRSVCGTSGGGMKSMLDALGLRLEGHHHSGLDDCRNIGRILTELLRRGGAVQQDMASQNTAAHTIGKGRTKGFGKGSKKSAKK